MGDPFARLGALVVRFRWPVVVIWLVILAVVGTLFASKASSVARGGGFDVPGSQSAKAAQILARDFGASTINDVVVVFHSDTLTVQDAAYQKDVTDVSTRLATVQGVTSVLNFFNTQSTNFVSTDQHTTFAVVAVQGSDSDVQKKVPHIRDEIHTTSVKTYVTGFPAISEDTFTTSEKDLRRSELFTLPVALILLLAVFRTVISSIIPLILGAGSVLIALSGLYFFGSHVATSIFALNVASMIGLGLGIDFSLLSINRFREERAAGRETRDAVIYTVMTSGRSITYSGITVILSMSVLTLLLHDLMIVRSISIGVMLVAAAGLVAGLTLLPALLAILGHRVEWLPVLPARKTSSSHENGMWYRLSHMIMAKPWRWLMLGTVILLTLALPLRQLRMVGASSGVLPPSTESAVGERTLQQAFDVSRLTPIQIVIDTKTPNGIWNPKVLDGLDQLTNSIKSDVRVNEVESLSTYLSAVPRDGRFQQLNAGFFSPAPAVDPATGQPQIPGIASQTVMAARVDKLPASPSFMGIGRFTVQPGQSTDPASVPGYEMLVIESGTLDVQAGPAAQVTRAGSVGDPSKAEPVGNGGSVTLGKGDQLSIPPNTQVSIRNAQNEPVQFLDASIFVIRPGSQDQTTWIEGSPPNELFVGLSRQVVSGAVATALPPAASVVRLQMATIQPGATLPRHIRPGPELIGGVSGTLTVYASPEMTASRADGTVYTEATDTPLAIPQGGRAIVQAGGIQHAANLGNEPAVIYSLQALDASQPEFIPVGLAEIGGQFVNLRGDSSKAIINIIPTTGEYGSSHQALVHDLRTTIVPAIDGFQGAHVYVGGEAASFIDFRDTLYHRFPLIVACVAVMIFIILMMFFQSLVLPIKAIFLNLMSILATYGVLVLIFQHGYGTSLLGFESQGVLNVVTPAVLYVILFALSTDYEVFMLSRVKEYFHETGNNEEAVAAGLQSTAGVITAAGLILVGTFGSFATADVVTIKEIGLGLAIGVLIDSTIVRVIMVPATMRLLGATNWWMPTWLKGIVPELREGPSVPQPVGAPAFAMVGSGGGVIFAEAPVASDPPASEHRADERPRRFVSAGIAQLRPVDEASKLGLIPLSSSRTLTIGRDEDSDLRLPDGRVSRRHAQISYHDGQYLITDLGSSNGILINGKRIDPDPARRALHDGDHIEIGAMGAFEFVFEHRRDM